MAYIIDRLLLLLLLQQQQQHDRKVYISSEREYWSGDGEKGHGTLTFYSEQRDDGLSKLISSPTCLTLEFERRDDLLTYIQAHLSTDERDVTTFTDETGNDVKVRPFIVRLRHHSLLQLLAYFYGQLITDTIRGS